MTKSLYCFLLFIPCICFADAVQLLPGQMDDRNSIKKTLNKTKGYSPFVDGRVLSEISSNAADLKRDPYLPNGSKEADYSKYKKGKGVNPLGSFENRSNLLSYKNKTILSKVANKGDKSLNFNYYKDTYNYSSKDDIYSKTFKNGSSSLQSGYLEIEKEFILKRGFVNYGLGVNIAGSFSRGKGNFKSSGQVSNAEIKLWSIPVDFAGVSSFNLGPYLNLNMSAGPSLMGLIQNRSDYNDGEDGKNLRQVSYGYFGKTKLRLNLSRIFPRALFHLYDSYSITRMLLSINLRYHSYSNFQDDIKIDGLAYGLGLSFNYF